MGLHLNLLLPLMMYIVIMSLRHMQYNCPLASNVGFNSERMNICTQARTLGEFFVKEYNVSSVAQEAAVLTVNSVYAHLNLSSSSVYKLLKSGELKCVRITGKTLVRRSDADELIARSVVL